MVENLQKPTDAEPIVPTVAAVPQVIKKEQPYEEKVKLMSDRQLQSELRRKMRDQTRPRINEIFATVLNTVFENHRRGMASHLRG